MKARKILRAEAHALQSGSPEPDLQSLAYKRQKSGAASMKAMRRMRRVKRGYRRAWPAGGLRARVGAAMPVVKRRNPRAPRSSRKTPTIHKSREFRDLTV